MISAKDLSEEQVAAVRGWAAEGAQLPEIQKRLGEEFGLGATYLDTRFLILDLGIELQQEAEPAAEGERPEPETVPEAAGPASPGDALVGGGGKVTVTTDEIARPGAMVSGTVTFSDGEKGVWFIDQLGRPGLDPDTPGYQPSDADLDAFEVELRKLLQGR